MKEQGSKIKFFEKNPLLIISLVAVIFTIFLLALEIRHGTHYFDVFVYLNNAYNLSGGSVGNTNMLSLAPLIPFLTSLIFRAGYVSSNAIIFVDAIIFVVGIIGLYLLFKERFNEVQSLMGSLIFISFPLIISWAVSGGTDIPGVSISIWTLYFLVRGFKRESKFLYLVFPLFILAFLTRYTSAVIIFPILFYIIINRSKLQKVRNVILSLVASLAIFTPIFVYLNEKLSNISLVSVLLTASIFVGLANGYGDAGYNPDYWYFLKNFLNYISAGPITGSYSQILNPSQGTPSVLSYIMVLVGASGLIIYVIKICQHKISELSKSNQIQWYLQGTILLLLAIGTVICFFNAPYILTEAIFFLTCVLAYYYFKESEKNVAMDLLFLSWFGSFFIFHSVTTIKLDRYFITMLPALSYFLTLGIVTMVSSVRGKIITSKLSINQIYMIIGLFFLVFSSLTLIGHVPQHCLITDVEFASHWVTVYDPHYQDEIIYSDYSVAYSWCLKKEVKSVPPNLNNLELSKLLTDSGAKYYLDTFSEPKPVIEGYHVIQDTDIITIYERN